jgi:hypothetical protein
MTELSDIVEWKYANLFVPDAEMSAGARGWFLFGSASAVEWLQRRMGGLWVGGAVTLTRDRLSFGPNALNAAAHAGDVSRSVPLDRIADVRDRFGILTGIIDVRLDDGGVFTFRCFGASRFAKRIAAAVRAGAPARVR